MKKVLAIVLSLVMLLMLAAACDNGGGNSGESPAGGASPSTGGASASPGGSGGEQPSGPKAIEDMTAADWENLKSETRYLKIELIPGYFTDELWNILIDGFKADHPNWTIDLVLDVSTLETQQPRILNNDPPAFFQANLDQSAVQAHEAGILLSNEWIMAAPAYDVPGKTVRETLSPGTDIAGSLDGHAYTIPYSMGANGFWYNTQLFEDNGWKEPKTFSEFLALCEQIKAAGITPLVFTATYAPYPFNMFLYPRICALGNGWQTSADLTNLVDGAWSSSYVRQAIEDLLAMRDAGVFTNDVLGTDYLIAQELFFEGKAAMVLSGTWLESEMLDVIPEGFRFSFMPAPVAANAGDSLYYAGWTSGFTLIKGSGMEVEASEFLRYLISCKFLKDYAEKMGSPIVTQSYVEFDSSMFSQSAMTIYEALSDPGAMLVETTMMSWYPSLYNDFCNGVMGILAGNETIDNLLTNIERQVQEIKADPSIPKYVYG